MTLSKNVNRVLTSGAGVTSVLILSGVISYLTGGIGYFFGIICALLAFWGSGWKLDEFGISSHSWRNNIIKASAFAIVLYLVMEFGVQHILNSYFGSPDISSFDPIRGNIVVYLLYLIMMIIVAGFGEEFLYRGYLMTYLSKAMGNTNLAWIGSAFMVSFVFGLAHAYQGISGMVSTGLIGLILSLTFAFSQKNLVLLMLIHIIYDFIGITLIFLGWDLKISELFG